MGFFSKFEGRMEDGLEGAADKMFDAPISPVQISKKAEKAMRREKMVGAGKQYAPTLYTVLVNPEDDRRLFGYYPTLAGETETYLSAKAVENGLLMDGQPLVRFIVDNDLKHGKFDIIAEMVSAPIIAQLRDEEMQRYGIGTQNAPRQGYGTPDPRQQPYGGAQAPGFDPYGEPPAPRQASVGQPLPYVPEDEIDRSIDYGEYTFDSRDFNGGGQEPTPGYAAPWEVAAQPSTGNRPQPAPAPIPGASKTAAFSQPQAVAPAPRRPAPAQPRLIDTTNNRTYELFSDRLVMGRGSDSDIAIGDINASRTHAEIRFDPQGVWVIRDLGSTNGTKVNGQRINAHALSEGDQITIGMTSLVFTQA